MKSAATFALCALLVLGYCSRSIGEHSTTVAPAAAPLGPPGTSITTVRSPTPHQGDGETASETAAAVTQKPSQAPSSSVAPVLSALANASDTNERVSSASPADAKGNDTDAANPVSTIQNGTQAPAVSVTDGTAVPKAVAGANSTAQTGSAAADTAATAATAAAPTTAVAAPAAPGNQTQASKGADLSSKDNDTLATSPPATAAPATAGSPAATQPIDSKTPSASTTTTTTTTTAPNVTTLLTTTAPEIIPQSASPVPGDKKTTGSSTTSSSTSATTTTITNTKVSTVTTGGSVAKSTTTTSPTAAVGHPTNAAALSELNVGDDVDSSKGVPDPLLAGLVSVFVVAAAIVSLLVFLKFRNRNERPEFRRLQDLPMDDMMEDTPLSMYSY